MRIGLMVGSEGERPLADRLPGLVVDGQADDQAGFTSMRIPQIPGYLDALTAIALIGQVTERIELGTPIVPVQTRHPVAMAQQAHHPSGMRWSLHPRARAIAPLWMADERAISEHVQPRITKAAADAGWPDPRINAGMPVVLCPNHQVDAARDLASDVLGHADFSPNYVRLLEHGDANDVGDTMAAGDEAAIVERLKHYRDAGVTELAVRVIPLGEDAATRTESRQRTLEFLATLTPTL
jgi:alkanesulfonate monooxygenase SsuD/methylene tetrahydromethanopterin reductase-like flavin-dependent oxidoreductase (luciferase family)